MYIDECYDIGRVENCHFWPFGTVYKHDDPYSKWINTNGVAFEFARTDWQYVVNTFCFGYGVGYKFSESEAGGCNGNFLGIGADSCRRAVSVEADLPMEGSILITNGEFVGRWGSKDSVGLEITESAADSKVSLTNCAFWGPLDRCIWAKSSECQLTANACSFQEWDVRGANAPAVQVDAGAAILQGNTFAYGAKHIEIGEKVRSAIIMGNQAEGGLHVTDHLGEPKTKIFGNEEDSYQWLKGAEKHYRIDVGSRGDFRFLENWHAGEKAWEWPGQEGTKRWSGENARILLPVRKGKRYTLEMDVAVPEYARMEGAGFYLNGKQLAPLPEKDIEVISMDLPKTKSDEVEIRVRSKNWQPIDERENTNDTRTLGISIRSLTMTMKGAEDKKVFNANTGHWME
jgi:hypothetical protein